MCINSLSSKLHGLQKDPLQSFSQSENVHRHGNRTSCRTGLCDSVILLWNLLNRFQFHPERSDEFLNVIRNSLQSFVWVPVGVHILQRQTGNRIQMSTLFKLSLNNNNGFLGTNFKCSGLFTEFWIQINQLLYLLNGWNTPWITKKGIFNEKCH